MTQVEAVEVEKGEEVETLRGEEFGRGGEAGSHRHKFRAERVSLSLKGFLFISFVLLSFCPFYVSKLGISLPSSIPRTTYRVRSTYDYSWSKDNIVFVSLAHSPRP